MELAAAIPSTQWTLVGGLMVQLHATAAGLAITRPTSDVDIVLHIETGATTSAKVTHRLIRLGYHLELSLDANAVAHRFRRGDDQIEVMIADHPAPKMVTIFGGRLPFRIPGGTQALKRTVDALIVSPTGEETLLSIPNQLWALVLKGAAYLEDSRDRGRHLEDAAVLSARISDPYDMLALLRGSDRSRITALHNALKDSASTAWLLLEEQYRQHAQDVLRILATNTVAPQVVKRLGE
ncbi:hypothetical protein [Arthrobacter livingstonensis]|nr:hypothetical protein [Arthrobacter livingstonensis]